MKPMPTIVFVFAVFSLLVVGSSSADEAERKKRHAHNNFYDGTFKITPSETTRPFGWKLTVKFSMKVKKTSRNFLPLIELPLVTEKRLSSKTKMVTTN